jgi:hypothetical protein
VAWQSSSKATIIRGSHRKMLLAFTLATGFIVGACGKQAVRASEKEFLADRIMQFDFDGQETAADEHILSNREGSSGGRGTGGGGCGCN